jgi:DNA-binding NtrC family response regulator
MGHRVRTGGSLSEMARLLEEENFSVALLDLMLPDGEALEKLPRLVADYPAMSVVIISAHGTIPKAVEAIKQGAVNFIQKPVNPEQLEGALINAIERWRLKGEVRALRRRLEPTSEFHAMVGQSEVMQGVYSTIESVANTMAPVMITGESGTGKELVARAIHASSPRAEKAFIAINCAAIPKDLLESEIFGHEKGAFTGAIEQHRGCFERADKGTLFLDEICEMDIGLQVKLLRLIQEQSFFRIGGTEQLKVNVRILAATNKDPVEMVKAGKFREDLFYRLNVLPIHLPPLRERREDIALIANRFLQQFTEENGRRFEGFERPALRALERQRWPGNVRELRNAIEQVVVLHDGERVAFEMLPERIQAAAATDGVEAARPAEDRGAGGPREVEEREAIRPFWLVERDEIQRALDLCAGNVQEVARRLELSPATLYRKIEKYGLVR